MLLINNSTLKLFKILIKYYYEIVFVINWTPINVIIGAA